MLFFSALVLLIITTPLTAKINFYQNDDWVYYRMAANFMQGNFMLDPISAPTFYSQGFLAALFSFIFGINRLPFLTLVFSVSNYLLVAFICYRFLIKRLVPSILVGLIVFFNPWHAYSIWGFMTENYFLAFLLAAILCFLYFDETKKFRYFIFICVFSLLAFLVRQVALVLPISLVGYYILKRELRPALYSGLLSVFILSFYLFLFPKTPEMVEKGLQFQHLFMFDYSYALVYGTLIMLVAVVLPLVFGAFEYTEFKKSPVRLALFVLLGSGLYFLLSHYFKPGVVSWGEFPYFENVWERTGFYPRGILGTKYHFSGIYDLYLYWDLTAKILLSIFIAYWLVFKRKIVNFFFIFGLLYLGLMILTLSFHGRYLLVLVPIFIFYLLTLKIRFNFVQLAVTSGFVVFLGLLSYQFSMDFVLSNRYVWDKSRELVAAQKIEPKMVEGANAWKLTYRNLARNYLYEFSYDSQRVNKDYASSFTLVEKNPITFPFSLFVDPNIYLYRRN